MKTNVLQAKKGAKAPAVGYDSSKMILISQLKIKDFVLGGAPVKALGEHNALVWDDSPECTVWRNMPQTTDGLIEASTDLKVLICPASNLHLSHPRPRYTSLPRSHFPPHLPPQRTSLPTTTTFPLPPARHRTDVVLPLARPDLATRSA